MFCFANAVLEFGSAFIFASKYLFKCFHNVKHGNRERNGTGKQRKRGYFLLLLNLEAARETAFFCFPLSQSPMDKLSNIDQCVEKEFLASFHLLVCAPWAVSFLFPFPTILSFSL